MKISFYKANFGNSYDKSVAAITFSKYSHCELVFADGMCGSASPRDGGVRLKPIDLDSHWDVFDLLDINGLPIDVDTEKWMRFWFPINDQETYDWVGAAGSIFGLDLTSPDKKFCSYVAASLLGLNPILSPGGLFRVLKKNKMIHV